MSTCVRILASLLLAAVLSSCSAVIEELIPDGPDLPTGATPPASREGVRTIFIPRRADRPRVEVTDGEFSTFFRAVVLLIRTPKQLGAVPRTPKVLPVSGVPLEASRLVQHYVGWCQRRGLKSDCVGVLHDGLTLADEDKPRIAMEVALSSVGEGFTDELRRLGDPNTIRVMVVSAMVSMMAALAVPTVVAQIAFATTVGVLIAYLGVETFWNLIAGYLRMDAEARVATTFGQLREAGERYGQVLGGQAAKVVIMVVLSALSEGGLVARLGIFPKAAQASELLAQETGGLLDLGKVGNIRGVQISSGGVTLTVATAVQGVGATALAMAAQGPVNPGKVQCGEENHHIATVENEISTLRGGPWTPRFKDLFDKVGLSMENAANKVRVYGHKGPHPEEYHKAVYEQLQRTLRNCGDRKSCREAFEATLRRLAGQIATQGDELNRLITRGCK